MFVDIVFKDIYIDSNIYILEIKQNYLTPYEKIKPNIYKYFHSYIDFNYKPSNKILNKLLSNSNAYILPNIDRLLTITDDTIENILVDISQEYINKTDYHLIRWLNTNERVVTKRNSSNISKYNINNDCITKCENINILLKNRIRELINILIKLRTNISGKIIHTGDTFIEFIYNNYGALSYLLQTNQYITKLVRLNEIINNCNKLSCHEIMEINELFDKKYKKIPILCGIVEIIFGNIIKEFQWKKIMSIYNNYIDSQSNPYTKWDIHQLMMGKGKSSIITPMLTLMLYNNNIDPKGHINIVVPDHLIKQTKETFEEYMYFFNIKPNIISDNDVKLNFLQNKTNPDDIYLIDEFDSMYNPIQSNFNIINNKQQITREYINNIFNIVHNYLFNNSNPIDKMTPIEYKYSIEEEIMSVLMSKNYIKNITYGMSNTNKYRYVIPYLRQDSPYEKSTFSSNIITIVLSILYFYDSKSKLADEQLYNYYLEVNDFKYLFINNNKLFEKIATQLNLYPYIGNIEEFIINYNKLENPSINKELMFQYIVYILHKLYKSTEISNCSFIDIMYMKSKWQVGYSGTVNIKDDDETIERITTSISLNKYNNNIIQDPDEERNVYIALHNTINVINIIQPINFEIFKEFDVIIDACALFKNYDNTEVAKQLFELHNRIKVIIYLLKDDTKMIYTINGPIEYKYKPYVKGEVVYYYSQRHIVGVDFIQANILDGIIILDKYNRYTEIAQAIYRMRKLNKGHTIKIGIYNIDNINTSTKVYNMIKHNERKFNKSNKLLLKYQYLKCYVRKKTHNYIEKNLKPLYEYKINNRKDLYKIFLYKIRNNVLGKINYDRDQYIQDLLTDIMRYNEKHLLSVLFNVNTIQQNIDMQVETESEIQLQITRMSLNNSSYSYIRNNYRLIVHFNPNKPITDFYPFVYYRLKINPLNLLFSFNLFKNSRFSVYIEYCVIIRLDDNNYMLDNFENITHYLLIKPIYSIRGFLINNNIENVPKYINFIEMFNYKLINPNNSKEIPLGQILFEDIELIPKETKIIGINDFNKLYNMIIISNVYLFKVDNPILNKINNTRIMPWIETETNMLYKINDTLINDYNTYILEYYQRKHFNNTYSLHINYPSYSYVELLDTYHDNDIIKKYDFIN